ncbi:MAG: hypothetical protein IH597_06535 [Bacteroidales bacterium]|nr:hypothetical protein [Bacteroidales bacterium]
MVLVKGKSFICILFLLHLSGFSQETKPGGIEIRHELDSISAAYFYDSDLNILDPKFIFLDTTLHHFHHYQALQHNGRTFASLGNTGLAYTKMRFDNTFIPISQLGINVYDAYRLTPQNLTYYRLNVPFTLLAYTIGKDREQVFGGKHYQQVRRNLGIGLGFNIYNVMGSYERQKSDNASLAFQALYRTDNNRYGIAGNFINNRFIHRESGGILNPSQFEDNVETDRSRISVRLTTAENRWRETNTYFKQYVHLTEPKRLENDSLQKGFMGLGSLVHEFNYQRLALVYSDKSPLSGYYPDILIDSTATLDSLVLHTVYNGFQWYLPLINSDAISFEVNSGIAHVFMHYRNFDINRKYNQLIPFLKPSLRIGSNITIDAHLRQVTGDLSNGDQTIDAAVLYRIGEINPVILTGEVEHSQKSPELFYQLYKSNHFEWENDFGQQKFSKAGISGKWKHTTAGITLTSVKGFAYLDSLAHPAWFQNQFTIMAAFVDSRLHWRRFTIDNKFVFQQLSDESALRLPQLIVNSTLAYELDLFKGALQAMGGVEVFYNSPWKAPAYMPATRSFYLQDQKETGNYIYADVFINLRIKRARIFLLMQHVNQGLTDYSYYMIPNYPMQDRAFKFGVNWMFYD